MTPSTAQNPVARQPFCGTFAPGDVTILLTPIQMQTTSIEEKERLIQSGRRHYSEMISREQVPGEKYQALFRSAVLRNANRFATDLWRLADLIRQSLPGQEVALVSLARAGTPVGVLIHRALKRLGIHSHHYSVSIIRDRGIDSVALQAIREKHPDHVIRFLDGWTGKGVIAAELASAIARFNERHEASLSSGLYAVADLCGVAAGASTTEDYLIPPAVLGATVAGLISRSILNEKTIAAGGFHGCLFLEELAPHDVSAEFADDIWKTMLATQPPQPQSAKPQSLRGCESLQSRISIRRDHVRHPQKDLISRSEIRHSSTARHESRTYSQPLRETVSADWLQQIRRDFAIDNPHYVKPGICEATRVLLRRVPDRLIVRSLDDPEVEHLLLLANQKCVSISTHPALPVRAVALIRALTAT